MFYIFILLFIESSFLLKTNLLNKNNASFTYFQDTSRKYQIAFTVLGVISLVFLLVTFYVYKAVPDLYNLHGKIVISNVVSIFLVTLYLIIVFNIIPSNSLFCVVLGYLVKTSCLFCFFTIWQNFLFLKEGKKQFYYSLLNPVCRVTLLALPCSPGWLSSALIFAAPSVGQPLLIGKSWFELDLIE